MIFYNETDYDLKGTIASFKLDSNLRYRVVGVENDIHAPRPLVGLSCHHHWKGAAYSRCPQCGDVAAEVGSDHYHWLDRATNQPVTYKDGSEARWATLDDAIDAFIEGKLIVECNEVL